MRIAGFGGDLPLPNWIDRRRIRAVGKAPYGRGRAVPERRPLIFVLQFAALNQRGCRGHKMNIDLDSREAGYAHGHQGRPPQCAIDLDQVSYFSGFCHGRAWRAQSRTKSTPSSDRLYSALIRYDPDDDWVRCGPPRLVQADAHWSWCWLRI
jgi:hypothetical protein